jgi:hypothetical protein
MVRPGSDLLLTGSWVKERGSEGVWSQEQGRALGCLEAYTLQSRETPENKQAWGRRTGRAMITGWGAEGPCGRAGPTLRGKKGWL